LDFSSTFYITGVPRSFNKSNTSEDIMTFNVLKQLKGVLITFNNYRKMYKNYFSVIAQRVLKIDEIEVDIRNGPSTILGSDNVAKLAAIFGNLYPYI
jgi:hypothetical protein